MDNFVEFERMLLVTPTSLSDQRSRQNCFQPHQYQQPAVQQNNEDTEVELNNDGTIGEGSLEEQQNDGEGVKVDIQKQKQNHNNSSAD